MHSREYNITILSILIGLRFDSWLGSISVVVSFRKKTLFQSTPVLEFRVSFFSGLDGMP